MKTAAPVTHPLAEVTQVAYRREFVGSGRGAWG